MDVSRICRREIVSLGADASPQIAAQAMRREHVGTVVVTDPREPGRVMGILTDRDLVIDVMAAGRPAETGTIGDLCHAELAAVPAGASLREAADAMRGAAVRRLFVMHADGSVLGLLSMDDVVEAMAAEFGALADALRGGIERERRRTDDPDGESSRRAFYLRSAS